VRSSLPVAWLLAIAVGAAAPATAVPTPPPPPGPRVHEWGVWKIHEGRIEHLADLARESPTFVRRATPRAVSPGGMLSRKPIVYVYADRPTDLTVRVGFTGGTPWLFFPGVTMEPGRLPSCVDFERAGRGPVRDRAMAAPCEPADHLRWRVRATPRGGAALPEAPRGHFWHHLRSVPAATLQAPDGSAEKFLFYDGPVGFRTAYRSRVVGGALTIERLGEAGDSEVIVANGDRWVAASGLAPGLAARVRLDRDGAAQPHDVRTEIRRRLRAAGLSAHEADSLVRTWQPEIDAPGLRAFWLVPRAQYDALLPIEVSPAPSEIVRVGLVIERI
jgi:hypothetical protein